MQYADDISFFLTTPENDYKLALNCDSSLKKNCVNISNMVIYPHRFFRPSSKITKFSLKKISA